LAFAGIALAAPASAQRRPPPEVVFEGTAIEAQAGLPHCGRIAVAGWVTFRVDRVIRGAVPEGVVRLVVGCPEMIAIGRRLRIEADTTGPRAGHFGMYSLVGGIPTDETPTFWSRRTRPVRREGR
jgi:hypothetical protein